MTTPADGATPDVIAAWLTHQFNVLYPPLTPQTRADIINLADRWSPWSFVDHEEER